MNNKAYKTSIASVIAGKIVDLAESQNKNHILDEVNLYGTSDKDGSVTMSFEWLGSLQEKPANDVLGFFKEIKHMLSSEGSEIHEQIEPSLSEISGNKRIQYRFRVFPALGEYLSSSKELVSN